MKLKRKISAYFNDLYNLHCKYVESFINEILRKLKSGHLLGYATDSIEGEHNKNLYRKNRFINLSKKYNVIVTPHLGGFTYESLNKTEEIMANFFYKNFRNKI